MPRPSCAVLVHGRKALAPGAVSSPDTDLVCAVTEPSEATRFEQLVDRVSLVDDVRDVPAVFEAVVALAATVQVQGLLAPVEPTLPVVGHVRSLLGLPGPGLDTIAGFTNKILMKDRLAAAGLPVAPYRRIATLQAIEDAAEQLGYPVVVKPAFGGGTIDITLVSSPEQARALVGSASERLRTSRVPLLAEAWVPMSAELHCDGVVQDGRVDYVCVSEYFDPLLGGLEVVTGSATLPAADPTRQAAEQLHQRVVDALGLRDGVTHLELFVTSEGLVVGEIACRPAGGGIPRAVLLQDGVDLWRALNRTCVGLPADVTPEATGGLVVNVDLPIRVGTIRSMTDPAQLAALPGVVDVEMMYAVGDTVKPPLWSAAATGIVYLRVASREEIAPAVAGIRDTFQLDVSPSDDGEPA